VAELDPEMCKCFLDEAKELLESVEQCFLGLEKADNDPLILDQILRVAHNIKGSAGAVGFDDLSKLTHKLESVILRLKKGTCTIQAEMVSLLLKCSDFLKLTIDLLRENNSARIQDGTIEHGLDAILVCGMCSKEKACRGSACGTGACGFVHRSATIVNESKAEPPSTPVTLAAVRPKSAANFDDSIRVALSRIDKLMNNVGELVILQTGLSQTRHLLQSTVQFETVTQMDKIIRDVQEITLSLRMVPLTQTFQKMQRIARDTSQALSKEVELHVSGEDIELDKNVLEQLSDPLVHLLRNAVDHGLETPEQRVALGKSKNGHVSLAAYHSGGRVVIEVKDDGKGLDPKKLVTKAVEKGLLRHEDSLTDEQAYQLIFAPGFSTKEEVTNTSGRGVGMDVVKTNITALQGEVSIETALGKGTAFRISLPLTLAIVEAMVVKLGHDRYVVPIVQVSETIQMDRTQISTVGETGQILKLRKENIPVLALNQILGRNDGFSHPWESVGIIVRDNMQKPNCILVDKIVGQQQVVIKQLGDEVNWLSGVMGAAILGDGEAVLILDLQELLRKRIQKFQKVTMTQIHQQPSRTKEAV